MQSLQLGSTSVHLYLFMVEVATVGVVTKHELINLGISKCRQDLCTVWSQLTCSEEYKVNH